MNCLCSFLWHSFKTEKETKSLALLVKIRLWLFPKTQDVYPGGYSAVLCSGVAKKNPNFLKDSHSAHCCCGRKRNKGGTEAEACENCYCPTPASTDVHVHTPLDSQPNPFSVFVHLLRAFVGVFHIDELNLFWLLGQGIAIGTSVFSALAKESLGAFLSILSHTHSTYQELKILKSLAQQTDITAKIFGLLNILKWGKAILQMLSVHVSSSSGV